MDVVRPEDVQVRVRAGAARNTAAPAGARRAGRGQLLSRVDVVIEKAHVDGLRVRSPLWRRRIRIVLRAAGRVPGSGASWRH